ncbi:hypothetical protein HN51_016377 [Arachis hypogaea]
MTMKSVVSDALKMVEEVCRQFNTIPGLMEGTAKPDYATCVKISTDASIKEMILPGALVMLTPLIVGIFFGVETLSGVLAGSLVSGVQVIFFGLVYTFYYMLNIQVTGCFILALSTIFWILLFIGGISPVPDWHMPRSTLRLVHLSMREALGQRGQIVTRQL